MKNIEAETAKLAGLQIDLLQKVRSGKITLKEFEDFLNQRQKRAADLGVSPKSPFNGAEVVKHDGKEIVEVELRSDDSLYINGKKVILHLPKRQMGNKRIFGHEVCDGIKSGIGTSEFRRSQLGLPLRSPGVAPRTLRGRRKHRP